MLNVIAEIGAAVSGGGQADLLEFLIPDAVPQKYIVGLDFKLDEQKVEFELLAEGSDDGLSRNKLVQYLFVPAEKGNRPQFSPTSPNLGYLISQTLPNLRDFLPENSDLRKILDKLCDAFFVEIAESGNKKTALVLSDRHFSEQGITFPEAPDKLKGAIAECAKSIAEVIAKQTTAPAKESLYTVCVDGEPLARHPDYRHFLLQKNAESAFEGAQENPCSICGKVSAVTQDTTRFTMKFYMTDKVNFASHFDSKNYFKAVALCSSCYQNILIGEKWIQQNLRTRLGGFDLYVVPQVGWQDGNAAGSVFSKLGKVTHNFNEIKNVKSLRDAEEKALQKGERLRLFEGNPFVFNLLCYRKSQSAFKILTLIKDVPPIRLDTLAHATNYVDSVRKALHIDESISFDLERIYRLIPLGKIKIKGSNKYRPEYNKLLQLYHCIFSALPLQKDQLFKFFTQLACAHHFQNYPLYYNISESKNADTALKEDTLRWNLFLLFLQHLNLIEGEKPMETTDHSAYFPDGVQEAFTKFGYSEAQQGLALLGYVIGVIAWAQSERENLKNKPILGKINYQGMSEEKVVRLFDDAFEKVHQYRKHIGYAERWCALALKLYQSGRQQKLTADERVFYLLSGYAMNLLRAKPATDGDTADNELSETVEEMHSA